nr:hypothetical protein [Tanacetum cinerariifolium]
MTTLAKFMILSGGDNRPPMLDKDLYDSWQSRMEPYMKNRGHGRIILDLVKNGPLIWPTIEENGVTRIKTYTELSATEKIQADCDVKETNIILQGLPLDVYALVNHHRIAKDLWERIQLVMQGTSFTKQERKCKFLLPEWSKFVTDVKLMDSGLTVSVVKQGDDPINVINKMRSFLSTVVTSRFPYTNNQLRNSSNPRQQASIHDGRVTVQPLQGRLNSYVGKVTWQDSSQRQREKEMLRGSWIRFCWLKQKNGKVLKEKGLEFLADLGIAESLVTQTVITHNATYQADDLDAYDSDCDKISTTKVVLMANLSSYGSNVLSEENESLTTTFNVFKNESMEKEAKNINKEIDLEKKVKELDNIVYKMGQSAQMVHMLTKPQVFYDNNLKQALGFQNPFYLKKAQQIRPMLYDDQLSKDFRKRFVPQQDLSAEQAFWFQMSNLSAESSDPSAVKADVPSELPRVCLVNEILKKLKSHLAKFDSVVKTRITPSALTEAQSQEKDMVIRKLKESIKFSSGNENVENVKKDIDKLETINVELEHSVAKLISKNKLLHKEIVHLKKIYKDQFDSIKRTRALSKEHCDSLIAQLNFKSMENADLKGVVQSTSAIGSRPTCNTNNNMISQSSSRNKTNKVEDQPRSVKSWKNKRNCAIKTKCNAQVMKSMSNANFKYVCAICNECFFDANHHKCVLAYTHDVNKSSKSKPVKHTNKINIWKPTGKVFTEVGLKWKPTGRTFTLVGNLCPLSRITSAKIVPQKKTTPHSVETQKPELKVYSQRPKQVIQIVLWYLDSGYSKHMTRDRSQLTKFVHKFLGTVKFGNDQIAKIKGYGDNQIGNVTISRNGLVRGLPKLKSEKDHLRLAWAMGKSKKQTHKPKFKDTNQKKLYLLHMDLCGPMRVASVNVKKYILVIVDDYSLFTWVKFLAAKDEAPDFIINYYENISISHETSVARTPQQSGIVERQNRTLIEAARTMKIYAKTPLFLWAETVVATCYTQNRSIIRLRHGKMSLTVFDEFYSPLASVDLQVPTNLATKPAVSTGTHSSKTVDQDEPSLKIVSEESPSSNVIPKSMYSDAPISEHLNKWTKDYPLQNIIVEPKAFKDALTQACWIEAMQEELHEFKHLEVWELVPRQDKVMVITLKWMYKITAEVLEIYMRQFWNTIMKIRNSNAYNFKLDKKKCRVDTEELSYSGKCEMLSAIHTDQMHQPWRTFAAIINRCISGKTTGLDRLRELQAQILWDCQRYGALIPDGMINQDIKVSKAYNTYYDVATGKVSPNKVRKFKKHASPKLTIIPALPKESIKKSKRVKRSSKKSTTVPTVGVVIKDTPALKKSRQLTHKLQASGSSEGTDFESKGNSEDEGDDNKNDDDSANDNDGGNNAHDSEWNNSDDRENPSFTLKDYEEEKHDDEYDDEENVDEEEYDDLYKDVNVKSLGATESSKQSSSISSDITSKFLNLDNVSPVVDEFAFTAPIPTVPPTITMIIPLLQLMTPSPVPTTASTTTLIPALLGFSSLFGFDQRVSTLEKELSQFKQADYFVQLIESVKSQIPIIVDDLLSIRIRYATRTAFQSYTKEFEKKLKKRGSYT